MLELKDKYDVVIVGAGVAGLNCALNLPGDKSVLIISKKALKQSDSYLAQGGICCLRSEQDYGAYYEDTMRAGHYENDPESVECMIRNSKEIIDDLVKCGVRFDREEDGSLSYTREGGHTSPRVCYHEDSTGKEITTALLKKVKRLKNVTVAPYVAMLDIIEDGEKCLGLVVHDGADKRAKTIYADYTVLATGGIGGAFGNTTNFSVLTGDSVAICLKHGVEVMNVNYIQIHPTTLYSKRKGRRFLISESVRGEGAHLLDKNFNRFTDELKPRDVVKTAVFEQMKKDGTNFVWLDLRPIPKEEVASHFPQIVERCAKEGYDVFTECIPVVPAIHYFMGGVKSDLNGRTSLSRLYAVGETCCNGVHGKNRLASNSLLESLVFAKRAAKDIQKDYCPLTMAQRTGVKVDLSAYSEPAKLQREYKKTVKKAVRFAEAGKDVNAIFREEK